MSDDQRFPEVERVFALSNQKLKKVMLTDGYGSHRGHYLRGVLGLDEAWVACSISIPHEVVPRPGFEDGMIWDRQDYLRLYYEDCEVVDPDDLLREVGAAPPVPSDRFDYGK